MEPTKNDAGIFAFNAHETAANGEDAAAENSAAADKSLKLQQPVQTAVQETPGRAERRTNESPRSPSSQSKLAQEGQTLADRQHSTRRVCTSTEE